jgi:type II restriction enzyme
MPKVDEAISILKAIGLPKPSAKAAYILLALANMNEQRSWKSARRRSMRIHDIIVTIRNVFKVGYAENTREDFRKQVLKPFERARVVDRNPDNPTLATNDPRTHYALTQDVMTVLNSYGSDRFETAASRFTASYGNLAEAYAAARKRNLVPVTLPTGEHLTLAPGKHNELQAAVIEAFAPRFAPGGKVMYLGDAADKTLHLRGDELAALGVPLTKNDKLPDVVIYLPARNWLLLIEAVTSSGPVSPGRRQDLEKVLNGCSADRVYVTAFLNFSEFKRHVHDIAWETEVWIAENPDHLIHYNGEKFLGPFPATTARRTVRPRRR